MARPKKTTKEVVETNVEVTEVMNEPVTEKAVEEKPAKKQEEKKKVKTYADNDIIPCQSIMSGYVNFFGHKTKLVYEFLDKGDIAQIEYQDLRAAMIARDVHIYGPMFVIMDDELLELPEWKSVKDIYDKLYSKDDLSTILDLPVDQMREVVSQLPSGAKSALVSIAKAMIDNKTFDSMNKVKALDELLGTDLMLFLMDEN